MQYCFCDHYKSVNHSRHSTIDQLFRHIQIFLISFCFETDFDLLPIRYAKLIHRMYEDKDIILLCCFLSGNLKNKYDPGLEKSH